VATSRARERAFLLRWRGGLKHGGVSLISRVWGRGIGEIGGKGPLYALFQFEERVMTEIRVGFQDDKVKAVSSLLLNLVSLKAQVL